MVRPLKPVPPEAYQRRILRTPAAAAYVGLGVHTLEKLRIAGGGPPFVRLGLRAIGYDVRDLDRWIDAQKLASTSEGNGAGALRESPSRKR